MASALVIGLADDHRERQENRQAPWKTKESANLATLEWVSWFNHLWLLEPLGYIPPAEAEANDYRQLANQAATPA